MPILPVIEGGFPMSFLTDGCILEITASSYTHGFVPSDGVYAAQERVWATRTVCMGRALANTVCGVTVSEERAAPSSIKASAIR